MSENDMKDFEEDDFSTLLSRMPCMKPEDFDDISSMGHKFDRQGKFEKAAECFAKDAELGDVEAKFKLGQYYEHGKGVPQDYVKAAELYIEVSECEDREKFTCSDPDCPCVYPQYEAEYALGSFYERGLLPESTIKKAVEWYSRAQNDGSNEADYKLVECYLTGKGVEQNYDMAAEKLYSAHYWSNGHDVRSFTFAKALDGKTETHQLQICEILAECYTNGIGTDKDEEKALEYQKKAEALRAKLEAEAKAWAEKMLKNIKNRASSTDGT